MNADVLILEASTLSFSLFLMIQIGVFRTLSAERVLSGIIGVFLAAGLLTSIGLVFTVKINIVLVMIVMWGLYGFLAFLYIVGVFGVIESSIRIKLLQLVSIQSQGLRYSELLKRYNRDIIVTKRLKRLIGSGELMVSKGKYRVGKRFSFFLLPAYFSRVMKKLYGVS